MLAKKKANNFNGDNLLECDQKILQEIGIKKIGDRVRIFVAIKQLRNKTLLNRKKSRLVSSSKPAWICPDQFTHKRD